MLSFNQMKITSSDYGMILVVFLLICVGLVAIYSASYQVESPALRANFAKQLLWFFIATVLMVVAIIVPTRGYFIASYWMYGLSIIFLILTLIIGHGNSVMRWITIGPFKFQPSEFAKIAIILTLARYLSDEKRDLNKLKDIGIAAGLVFVPFLLIARQPDLGTSLVFMTITMPILYWAGLPAFYLFTIFAPFLVMIASFNFYTFSLTMLVIAVVLILFRRGLFVVISNMILNISVGIITPILWNMLHDYQKHRILTFIGLEMDPRGLSYQVIQSKVAIGSGGLLGKGLTNGTQTQLRFLPAQHTDFVFSLIGEEMGFVGSLFVIVLFMILLLRGIHIASRVRNQFSALMAIGAVTVIGFHVIVNIGMTVGMLPVTGLPLPFVSYGGSFLIVCMILIGMIINASVRRYRY